MMENQRNGFVIFDQVKRGRIFVVFLIFLNISAISQPVNPLKVGDQIPKEIWETIPKKENTSLVILDFWSTWCGTCLKGFPKMVKLQSEFHERIQIVLINSFENNEEIQRRFAKLNKGRTRETWLNIPSSLSSINGNPTYHNLFPHTTVPHHVWLTGNGKVIAITADYNVTEERIRLILKGDNFVIQTKDDSIKEIIKKVGYIQPTIKDLPSIHYSAFVPFYKSGGNAKTFIDSVNGVFRKIVFNKSPIELLIIAFSEKSGTNRVVYELEEINNYIRPKDGNLIDEWKKANLYSYEFQGSLKEANSWHSKMQIDANYFFGNLLGIQAAKERRKFRCSVVSISKPDLVMTKGGKRFSSLTDSSFVLRNTPLSSLMDILYQFENIGKGALFFFEAENTDLIDIELKGDMQNLEHIKSQLRQFGLEVIEEEREVEVLVIKNKPGWKTYNK